MYNRSSGESDYDETLIPLLSLHSTSTSSNPTSIFDKMTKDQNEKKGLDQEVESGDTVIQSDLQTANIPTGKHLGLISSSYLSANRIIGVGVFSTTSTILAQSGSVGMSLLYWSIGSLISFASLLVYSEFATVLPLNGGEYQYIRFAYRKPKYLIASMYASQAFLLAQAAGNANAAGQYFLRAGGSHKPDHWKGKGISLVILLSAAILHSISLKWGVRFQTSLGHFKLIILIVISCAGFAALAGHSKQPVKPSNFQNAFKGSRSDIYGISQCIYNAGFAYQGYTNLFMASNEMKNPIRTFKIGAPLILLIISILYELCQIAYFAAIPIEMILESKQIIAATFFQQMFGESSARIICIFVALSSVANVFTVIFTQGRLIQAMARDGLIPFQKILSSNKPFNTPFAGLFWHTLITLIMVLSLPEGDAFNFFLNLSSYPLNLVNTAVGLALIMVYLPKKWKPEWAHDWNPKIRATLPITIFFTLVNLFLIIVPWIPPKRATDSVYDNLWYALAPAVSLGIFFIGFLYWLVWYIVLPKIGGYKLHPTEEILSDGTKITKFIHVSQ